MLDTRSTITLVGEKKQREENSVSHVGAGSWDEDGTVEAAEVPFYLRARVLVPVAVSLGIIVISVVVAFGYYRRILASQGSSVKYESCVLSGRERDTSWSAVEPSRSSFVRRSVAESIAYDSPWEPPTNPAVSVSVRSVFDQKRRFGNTRSCLFSLQTVAPGQRLVAQSICESGMPAHLRPSATEDNWGKYRGPGGRCSKRDHVN